MELEEHGRPFDRILKEMANPSASKRRDPRAVRLAAVTSALMEVIDSQDCSASKIYAKAVTTLEGTLTSSSDAVEESISTQQALIQLLAATVPHVSPPTILVATLPLTSRVLRAIVASTQAIADEAVMETKDELGGVTALLRWTCRASGELFKCLGTRADEKALKQFLLGTLLTLFRDRRSKVRKAAQEGALEVLLLQESGASCHPVVAKTLAAYVHSEITKTAKTQSTESFSKLLNLLPFIEGSIVYLNYVKLSSDIMELLTLLMRVDDISSTTDFVTTAKIREVAPKIHTIESLLSVVVRLLEDESAAKKGFLDEFASRVAASLLQSKPSLVFRQGAAEFEVLERGKLQFGQTLLVAIRRCVGVNKELSCKLLPLVCQLLLVLSRPSDEAPDDATVAESLIVELTQFLRTQLPVLIEARPPSLDNCLHDTLRHFEQIMHPSFSAAWLVGLKCLAVLLTLVHPEFSIQDNIESLIRLRGDVSLGSPLQHIVEDSLSTLVQGIGLEACWGMIQFNLDTNKEGVDVDRAWILPTLKEAVSTATPFPLQLSFFQNKVLAMARACDKLAAGSRKNRDFHRARVIDLWSLFPCFCRGPADVEFSLAPLSATIGRAIQDKRYPELVAIICGGLSVLGREQYESLASDGLSEGEKKAFEAAAVGLLPVLFKLVSEHGRSSASAVLEHETTEEPTKSEQSTPDGTATRHMTDAIASLARLAPKAFLHSLFQKLMHRLLEEVQSDDGDRERVCSLLSLSESLVASEVLDDASISFLYRALKPLIRDDAYGARVQKRAYKVLVEICQRHHTFVTDLDRLKELSSLLSGTIMTSQVAARYMRLKCLHLIIEGLSEDRKEHLKELSSILGEVLLCLKDSNGKSREAAYQVLLAMASRSDFTEFLQQVTAGLGAETPHMRSATVMALSRLVFTYGWDDTTFQSSLPSLLQTVLVLISENSREVIKSVIGFIRISVSAIPPEELAPVLPDLVASLLTYQKKKDRFRAKIKIILKKLVKLYGYERLMPYVPDSETRLLTHMRKLEERLKRQKAAQREARQHKPEEFDDMLDSDEEDSDDGRTFLTGATGFSRLTGKKGTERSVSGKSAKSRASRVKSAASMASTRTAGYTKFQLPDEMDGDVVDMLGTKISRRVHFQDQNSDDGDDSDGAMEFNDDGKLIIAEDLNEEGLAGKESLLSLDANKRRRLTQSDGHSRRGDSFTKASSKRAPGAAYKSKRAGGDVRKKGQKYEPYAFMPLDGRAYSKKNRRAAVEQMSSVVRGKGKRKRN